MILYHFTSLERLPQIKAEGLTRGELPLSPTFCLNAVWFTTSDNPEGHGLCDARALTAKEKQLLGIEPGKPAFFPNKRAVRIAADVPEAQVVDWLEWSRANLSPAWAAALNRAGGGMAKARTWRFSFLPVPPQTFTAIDLLSKGTAQ